MTQIGRSTPTLDYARPLFVEQQRAGRAFPRASYVIGAIAVAFICMCFGIASVNRRLALAFVPGLGIGAITCGFVAMMMFGAHAITIVEPSMIQLRLSVLGIRIWKRTIELADIRRVDVHDMTGRRRCPEIRDRAAQLHDPQEVRTPASQSIPLHRDRVRKSG